jgi:hypothetical protein
VPAKSGAAPTGAAALLPRQPTPAARGAAAKPAERAGARTADPLPAKGQDPDVDLVAALMAHIAPAPGDVAARQGTLPVAPTAARSQASAQATTHARAPAPQARQRSQSSPHQAARAPSTAQAAARAVPSTRPSLDQRVQHCKARYPDKEDSRACRRRVCEDHWGRHAACPVRLMARPATTA